MDSIGDRRKKKLGAQFLSIFGCVVIGIMYIDIKYYLA